MANLNDFQEQLDILSATKTSIKEAIIGKGQEVSSEDSFSSYADKIDDIVTLEEGTADADAVASDIEIGKTAYVNGQKITGNIEKFKSIAGYASILDSDITGIGDATSALLFTTKAYSKSIIPGGNVHIYVYKSRIASQQELTADKLKVGESVLGITGTFTDDADATASDILSSKTAYVNGNKITGSMRAYLTGEGTAYTDMTYFSDDTSSNRLRVTIKLKANQDGYVSSDYGLTQLIPYSSIQNKIKFLSAGNIKDGVTILGVTGNVIELNGETKTITPTTSQQVITPSQDKNAITEVTVNAVTSAIDSNIQAENIKNGVTILGITGTAQVIKEYSTYQEIEQALLDGDIETGDVVLCGGTYTFYLCEINTETGDSYLEKLVKESETISPSDYTEAEEQIGDLFGEEENN